MERGLVLKRRIRVLLAIVMAGLLLSGVTAFPLEWELELLTRLLGVPRGACPDNYSGIVGWLAEVREGLQETYYRYPWMAYGTDWLAFAHIILAVLFVGPWVDPVRNLWVIHFGLIASALVIPLAMVCGPIRGIPFYWRLIDCSFGVLAFVPLWFARRFTLELSVPGPNT
ncbi:MAG TPA: hypothetical protein VNE39_18890 [Planctomycetota bacterium]|nr:hypothetical protein [Planctomycetota bacterium]